MKELLFEVKTLLEKRVSDDNFLIQVMVRDDCCVRADPEQLKQVFLNIGINAVEAMEGGGILQIRLSEIEASQATRWVAGIATELNQRFARADFIDNGTGIAPDVLPRIFDPFFTTKTRGTGLGLTISQRIIEAHNGKIIVRSQPKRGSRFTVLLESVL